MLTTCDISLNDQIREVVFVSNHECEDAHRLIRKKHYLESCHHSYGARIMVKNVAL